VGSHPLTLSPSHPLTHFTLSPSPTDSHPLTLSPSHPLTPSPSHPLTLSTLSPSHPSHPLTLSPSHPLTLSPTHPLTLSPTSPSHPLTLSPSHPLTLSALTLSPPVGCHSYTHCELSLGPPLVPAATHSVGPSPGFLGYGSGPGRGRVAYRFGTMQAAFAPLDLH